MLLAGDIGGTKTHLALCDENKKRIREEKFPSQGRESLEEIVHEFLGSDTVEKACFGIAGPVVNNTVQATNLPWSIDPKNFHIKNVTLLNDVEANAYGLFELNEKDMCVINEGEKRKGNRALVSAGTGLGEAGIFYDGTKHTPFACEGGHVDFAPRTEEEVALFTFLKNKFERVSYERILSGPGLYNVYQFLSQKYGSDSDVEQRPEKERPKAISENTTEVCQKAVELFVSIYGAEAGNCALKFMAYGGVFLGGGIAPKMVEKIKSPTFLSGFTEKGRMGELVSQIPVTLVLEQETALLGAMHYVVERM